MKGYRLKLFTTKITKFTKKNPLGVLGDLGGELSWH
jgi:hypothetical protein